ncbi:hypothetical protein K474DRAFT_1670796, partial [Panus rudis PR-1116 ss-1]
MSTPASVFREPGWKSAKKSKADICQIKRASPRIIAHAAIHARFFLTAQPDWCLVDRYFDLRTFYWNIVDILQGPLGKKVLPWYDRIVFNESLGSAIYALAGPSASALPIAISLPPSERIKAQIAEAEATAL